jgi:ABC-type glycerol-3-phosphate transport system substrate-binding protein
MNGPFVNVSLFKKAGVALPSSDKVTWEEWMKLAKEVKEKNGDTLRGNGGSKRSPPRWVPPILWRGVLYRGWEGTPDQ